MLILKAIMVPIFIAMVTLAGRKWGHGVAGILAGFPIVAGPIIIFVTLDHGTTFGQQAALAAINGVLALIIFTITFCWVCSRFPLLLSILIASIAWLLGALIIQAISPGLILSALLSTAALTLAFFLLPKTGELSPRKAHFKDMPWRMAIGAILTLAITTLASQLGSIWSGTLAVFPVIGLVLASFVFLADGPDHVIEMYRGMLAGLYTFVTFFVVLASVWPASSIWQAYLMAITISLIVQLTVQLLLKRFKPGTL